MSETNKKTRVSQQKAEAEPKHGPIGPLTYDHLVQTKDVPYLKSILVFSAEKRVDFMTIKCNDGKKFQKMDDVRRLLARHYNKYFIVKSPKSGIHFHALACRDASRTIKVPKGIHFNVRQVGLPSVFLVNRQRHTTDQPETAVDVIRSLRPIRETTNSTSPADMLREISNVMHYLLENMLENKYFNKYETFWTNI